MKTLIKLFIVIILSTGIASCDMDDFFNDPRPQETQWVNTTTFDQGVTSAYRYLFYSCLNGGPMMLDYAMCGASQLLPETTTSVPYNEMYGLTFSTQWSTFTGAWEAAYRAITMSNTAIELDTDNAGNPFGMNMATTDYTDNYVRQIGEFYFLRAYSYLWIVKNFAAPYVHNGANTDRFIPFSTKVAKSKDDIYNMPLGTNAEVYDQIISDLRTAKSRLPEAYKSATMLPTYEVGRATKYSAAALLAKVLFLTGDYSGAEQELNFVIEAAEAGRYTLDQPIEAFNKLHSAGIAREAILEFDSGMPNISNTTGNMYFGMIINLNFRDAKGMGRGTGMVKSGWNQFTMSYWLLDKVGWMTDPKNGDYSLTQAATDDLRAQQVYYYLLGYKKIDPNTTANPDYFLYETLDAHAAVKTPQMYVDKYFRGGALGTTEAGNYTKFPLIRLADMYLIRAWVRWKAGNANGAASDMNRVWNRANPNNPDIYNSGNVNHDAIFTEYLREMTGEGWTTDFMMATQMPIPAADRTNLSDIQPPYSIWHWNIPSTEKDLNPNF